MIKLNYIPNTKKGDVKEGGGQEGRGGEGGKGFCSVKINSVRP